MKRNLAKQDKSSKRICSSEATGKQSIQPSNILITQGNDRIRWERKEWNVFIELCLEFFAKETTEGSLFLHSQRLLFPKEKDGIFGYFFKGKFLPSGNQDGLYWRPSQGVALKGSKLHKRYFYARLEDEQMIKRQVTWIADLPNYCFVEYRRNYDGDVQLSDLCGPPTLDWMSLMAHVLQFHNGLLSSPTLVLPSLTIESDPKGSDSDISSPSSSPFISPNQSEESFNRSNHTFERSLWSDFIINTSFEFI
eukprot:TRINITY_DN48_c0_g1_i1.p1 TRINITY_DN48_c0_g1~~TRINITY_DN48_c0_g1_i1.p1  ORF type:complete len:251 (+),score=76.86 TRINITY_DN48_c0_g1_i1:140-892(+)